MSGPGGSESRLTPVVLLHAAGLTPQMWQAQVEAIAAQAEPAQRPTQGAEVGAAQPAERQVMAPWIAGLRPGRPGELSLTGAAAQLVGTLDSYGIEQAILRLDTLELLQHGQIEVLGSSGVKAEPDLESEAAFEHPILVRRQPYQDPLEGEVATQTIY